MRWRSFVRAFLIASTLAVLPAAGAFAASVQVDIGIFYDDLAPHGRWIETANYGWVFTPAVSRGWRPYTSGHWVWTDEYGWLWASDEPYGWATYHYGRWYQDPSFGWAWVPGHEWAPAWVSFRSGGGYMGWAPLPPRYAWSGGGFRVGSANFDAYIPPRDYIFVPERSFLDRSVRRHLVTYDRNPTIIDVTRNTTQYAVVGDRIVNRSFDVEQVERRLGRRVPRVHAVRAESVREARTIREQGNQVRIFNPVVRQAAVDRTPPRGKALARARQNDRQQVRSQQQDAVRERRDAERRETLRRQQDDTQRRDVARQRQVEERRQAQQLKVERGDRQQLEKRQAQERNQMERAHRNEIRRPPQGASTRELEQRREAQHRAMDQRQRQQQQDLQASREQARQARERRGDRPRAENLWQREPERPANRPQPQRQKQQQQQQRKKDQPQQEKPKGRR